MRKYGSHRPSATLYVRKRRMVRTQKPSFFFRFCVRAILLILIAAGLFFGGRAVWQVFAQAEFSNWHVKAVAISGVSAAVETEIQKQTASFLTQPFSATDAIQLERQFTNQFPMLENISVSRGFFSGKLKISARPRQAVARFVLPDHSYKYLDGAGVVYADPHGPQDILQIELLGDVPAQLPASFVDGVQNMLKAGKNLPVAALQLTVPEQTVTMVLTDKSVLRFGPADGLKEKAARAIQILNKARANYPAPFTVDFTYFNQGEVFLTHSSH